MRQRTRSVPELSPACAWAVWMHHGLFLVADQIAPAGSFLENFNQASCVPDIRPVYFVGGNFHMVVEVARQQRQQFAGAGDAINEGGTRFVFR